MAGCYRDDRIAVNYCCRAPSHDEAAICGARQIRNRALDFFWVTHIDGEVFDAERRRDSLPIQSD